MNRRQFLKTGAIATALAANGRLPLLSARSRTELSIDASTGPHAVKPIRNHLQRFSPVGTPLRESGQYSLVYDIIHWNWIKGQRGTFANSVVGEVAIERITTGSQVIYEIEQRMRIGGVDNFLEARIACDTDDLNSLRKWILRSRHTTARGGSDPLSEFSEEGRCNDGRIRVESDNHQYGFSARNPVVTQWTMLDYLMRKANPALNVRFDLLQDLSLFKPDQVLTYDGLTPVKVKDGKAVAMQVYAQTGQGVLPIHYLLDNQRRPQLITNSILSWALTELRY
jgi:hypothetical protein